MDHEVDFDLPFLGKDAFDCGWFQSLKAAAGISAEPQA
jgi:hypothetical protein